MNEKLEKIFAFKSEFGRIHKAEIIKQTPKGCRVKEIWSNNRHHESVWYLDCPHGNHKAFLNLHDAISDAQLYINNINQAALRSMERAKDLQIDLEKSKNI
tara:strand:- start:9165 stop:9467 length:303 start_codon:yes stop_codon:yes gene_type:complete